MRINSLSPINSVSSVNGSNGVERPVVRADQGQVVQGDVAFQPQQHQKVESSESASSAGSEQEFDQEMLDQSIQQANKNLKNNNRVIERAVHEVTGTVMYTVRDTTTHEVIAEFPPKRIQDMIAKMWELAGLFVDEKA